MNILLANLPWTVGGRSGVRAGSRWPHLKIAEEENYLPYPFFLGYATSLLKTNGFQARGLDAIAEGMSEDAFLDDAIKFKPELVFAEVSTPSLAQDMRILRSVKGACKCMVAISGPDKNIETASFLKENPHIDFVIPGEYEETLLELAQAIKEKADLGAVDGLIFVKDNVPVKNKRRKLSSVDDAPWPDREDFPIYKYHDCPGGIPEPSAQVWASRGCPYRCMFCAWPQLMYSGNTYRPRDMALVAEEIEFLVRKKKFKSYYFDDDTFNIGKDRMEELARELEIRNINVPWAFMGRADLADKATLQAFRKVGLHAVKYGVESSSQEILDRTTKGLDIKKAVEGILATKELGIKVHLTFTFGLPGETAKTIDETIKLALFLDPDSVQFSIATPFPGTRFYDLAKSENMIVSESWSDFDGNSRSVIKTGSLMPEDLEAAQKRAYEEWKDHRLHMKRYVKLSPVRLFTLCLKEHGLSYTMRKSVEYLRDRRFKHYFKQTKNSFF
ncbi:MAG: radical SAM protein [Nanoarchaeota archaeon]|nr:radical SAM protein [Nanoarchaeota archaeon]